ncbi:MAG: Zn-dependent exopeptidase M28 [Acidobacteria bacterium]|nr:MAG: Zn-dependent exopeptidase M28 [Acidobacteriota bacterium]
MRRVGPLLGMAVLLAGSFATGGAGRPGAPGDPPLSERPSPSAAEPVWPEAAGVEHVPAPVVPSDGAAPARLAFTLVSPDRMLADLSALTAIGQDALFRTSGTSGEREAFDLVASRLSGFSHLAALGATVERVPFRVPLASEVHEASLSLRVGGSWVDVPAHALQGHRDDLSRALRFDSDGRAGDDRPDPVTAEGSPYFVQLPSSLYALPAGSMQGRVLFADYALLDRGVVSAAEATQAAAALLLTRPAALVLVTRYSNVRGEAHGSFVGDVSSLVSLLDPPPAPTLYARLEDLGPAGITDWAGLERVTSARVTWDQDVNVAAPSQLLAFRIPGADPSRAVLLGAHLDSPNSPGGLDDGSGSVALLETARVLDESRERPPVETVLVFFGSHERGLYGSSAFAAARSDLLDRAVAMLQLDCLTHPLDGLGGSLVLEARSHRALGDPRLPFPEALAALSARQGVGLAVWEAAGIVSDNSSFDGFDVPATDTIFASESMTEVHVEGHLHDPYDDVPLVALHRDDLADFARVALTFVLDLPREAGDLRPTPAPDRRAVFVASHTEPAHMTPAQQTVLGMALAHEGFDVDVVPYGVPVTDEELAGATLAVVLPVVDFADPTAAPQTYDEAWTDAEADALVRFAGRGGLLVVANSGSWLRYGSTPVGANEDALDANAVASRFGASFEDRRLSGSAATATGTHALLSGVSSLVLASGNGLAIRPGSGQVLARAGSDAALVLVPWGPSGGEVLVLSDLAVLGGQGATAPNLRFLQNLASWARTRPAP